MKELSQVAGLPAVAGTASDDVRTVDWSRVIRAVYQVRQHYRYTYTGPVHDLRQRLILVPVDQHGDQRLLTYHLDVRGADTAAVHWESDSFGNRISRVQAGRIDQAIDFEARYQIERDRRSPKALSAEAAELGRYREATALTAANDRLRAVAETLAAGGESPRVLADRAFEWTSGAIAYGFGVTGVQTPAALALQLGRGVCQDFTHILLCLLRLFGVPARYVSGHLLGEGAPHAWAEVFFEDASVPGGFAVEAYDPTNHRRPGLNYVTVAVGRDYADVSPTSGVFTGAASGRLSWSKQAEILEIEYAREPAGGEAAA